MSEHKNIYEALHEAYKTTGYVQKTGKVKSKTGSVNYNYAGEADLIEALRPALVENNIVFYCSDINIIEEKTEVSIKEWNGKETKTNQYHISGIFTFTFHHTLSDTKLEAKSLGKGVDTGDKAEYKAMTGALKYALRQTFVIETGDDPDKQPSEEQISHEKPNNVKLPGENKVFEYYNTALNAISSKLTYDKFMENNTHANAIVNLKKKVLDGNGSDKDKRLLDLFNEKFSKYYLENDEIPF